MSEQDWDKDFEPNSRNYDIGLQPLVSIAMSLKRIADAVEGNPQRYGLIDTILELRQPSP